MLFQRRDLDPRGVKTELVERLKAALKCPKNEMEVEAAGGDNNAGHESPEKGNDENSRRGSCGSELPVEAGPILEDREKTEAAIESDNTAKVQKKLNETRNAIGVLNLMKMMKERQKSGAERAIVYHKMESM